jgi:hypothetical protein
VKVLYAGIDIEVPQILLATHLREQGEKLDCLFLHHPQGRASVEMARDMRLQVEMYRKHGVPVVHIEQQIEEKIEETYRSSHGDNIFEWERSAKLAGFSALCCHTPMDNLAYQLFEKVICEKEYDCIGDLRNAIMDIPEFNHYAKNGLAPLLINCSEKSRTGHIAPTGITGGTDGPEVFIEEQSNAGIGTIIAMHVSDEFKDMAKRHHVNIIQVNHYAGDDLGMNLMLDLLQEKDDSLRVFEGCGFHRVRRTAKQRAFLRKRGQLGSPARRRK